jgi:hypothetical protein
MTDTTTTRTTTRTRYSRFKRTLLDDALRDGVPEPEEFEAGVLLKGAVHQVYAETDAGKSWVGYSSSTTCPTTPAARAVPQERKTS